MGTGPASHQSTRCALAKPAKGRNYFILLFSILELGFIVTAGAGGCAPVNRCLRLLPGADQEHLKARRRIQAWGKWCPCPVQGQGLWRSIAQGEISKLLRETESQKETA